MKSKLLFILIFLTLVIGVGSVLWPESERLDLRAIANQADSDFSDEHSLQPTDGQPRPDSERTASTEVAKVSQERNTDNLASLGMASIKIMINQQPVGVPMAFTWVAKNQPTKLLVSDVFGVLEIPAAGSLSGELQLPGGLDWAESTEFAIAAGKRDHGSLRWDPEYPFSQFDLVRLPGWHGRLLHPHSDSKGVVDARLRYRQSQNNALAQVELSSTWKPSRSRNTSSRGGSVQTDAVGGFFVQLSEKRGTMESVKLTVSESTVSGGFSRIWGKDELPADGWLGSLEMEAGGPLTVQIVDTDGNPVENAKVWLQDSTAEPTPMVGTYHFDSALQKSSAIHASAENYRPNSLKVEPPFTTTPYRLELLPTTRLEIHLLESSEFPISNPQFLLHASGSPNFLKEDGSPSGSMRTLVGNFSSSMTSTDGTGQVTKWQVVVHPVKNRIVLTGVRPELPLTLQLTGGLGSIAVKEIPPRVDNLCIIEIEPSQAGKEIKGRVLNAEGIPIIGASVNLSAPQNQNKHLLTNLTGSFSLNEVYLDEVGLSISAPDHLPLELNHQLIPANGDLGNFQLQPARKLHLHFVYPDGSDAPEGFSVRCICGEINSQRTTRAKGYLTLKKLPMNLPVELSWTHGGAEGTRRIEIGEDKVRVEIPFTGELAVDFLNLPPDGLPENCLLCLQEPGAMPPSAGNPNGFTVPVSGPLKLPNVLLGSYRVALYRYEAGDELGDEVKGAYVRISNFSETQILANQTAKVELHLLAEN